MKEVVLRMEDSAYDVFTGFMALCSAVRIVSRQEVCDLERGQSDRFVTQALAVLLQNGVMTHPFDYTWIMVAIGDGAVKGLGAFRSPQSFMDYLGCHGVERVPSRSNLSAWFNKVLGKYPDWHFTDTTDPHEILRRKNVARQFISALNRLSLGQLDKLSDNSI